MNVRGAIKTLFSSPQQEVNKSDAGQVSQANTHFGSGNFAPIYNFSFDGEKNPGEVGIAKRYFPNHKILRVRSWQLYLDSDVAQAIIGKFEKWVIGSGLRLQSQPIQDILESDGISLDKEKFTRSVEQRFSLYANSRESSYDGQSSLHDKASEAFKNAVVAGDCLVILRIPDETGILNIQTVDAEKVFSPVFGSDQMRQALDRGNTINEGVELSPKGEHVAYFVLDKDFKMKRVVAKDRKGKVVAFLVYGKKYRIGDVRGIPLISSAIESISKLDRYKEAAVGSAEERQKIAYFIQHGTQSTGENPLLNKVIASHPLNNKIEGNTNNDDPIDSAAKIAATTNKQVFNLPTDSEVKSMVSDMELNFKDFFLTNLQPLCATMGIPIEVALSKFDSSFSAARAAIKDWEHTLNEQRKKFSDQFYKPVYELWLLNEDQKGTIKADGLFLSQFKGDKTIFQAYTNARWVGSNVPHIDPVKEANAERIKLGELGKNIPLTTAEQATEALGEGEYDRNVEVFNLEKEKVVVPEVEIPEPAER